MSSVSLRRLRPELVSACSKHALGNGWWMLLPPAVDGQDITFTLTWADGTTTIAPVHLVETYSERVGSDLADPSAPEHYPGFLLPNSRRRSGTAVESRTLPGLPALKQ